jgi:hypothetical protein
MKEQAVKELQSKYFTFQEGKEIIVSWYLARAEALETLSEESYFSFNTTMENIKKLEKHIEDKLPLLDTQNDADISGGRS